MLKKEIHQVDRKWAVASYASLTSFTENVSWFLS